MQKFTPGAVTQKVRFSFAAEEGWRVGPYDRYNWGYNRIYRGEWAMKENRGCFRGFAGDYTTQLCGMFFINH